MRTDEAPVRAERSSTRRSEGRMGFLRRWLGRGGKRQQVSAPQRRRRAEPTAAETPSREGRPHYDDPELLSEPLRGIDDELVHRIGARLQQADLDLPRLPSTMATLIEMSSNPDADVAKIVANVADDPVLSMELLRLSNSAAAGASAPAETLQEAILRVGLRSFRGMVLAMSLKSIVFRDKSLDHVGAEVWKHSFAQGCLGRVLAPTVSINRDLAFVLCLLADLGKAALILLLHEELEETPELREEVDRAAIARVFHAHHEAAGERMARAWALNDEIAYVAGRHHDFRGNIEHPRFAAFVSLVQRLHCHRTLHPATDVPLEDADEMDVLGLDASARREILASEDAMAPAPQPA